MEKLVQTGIIILATVGFVAWLGGGRKWAFRMMAGALALAGSAGGALLLYSYGSEKITEHRNQKIHECAVAKLADPKCEKPATTESQNESNGWEVVEICPAYTLPDNPSAQHEQTAVALAEQECRGDMNPNEKPLHEEIAEYRRKHNVKTHDSFAENGPKGDIFDQLVKDCASKVRKDYPRAYDDIADDTLIKKVLAKYPHYCNTGEGDPPGWKPVLEGVR